MPALRGDDGLAPARGCLAGTMLGAAWWLVGLAAWLAHGPMLGAAWAAATVLAALLWLGAQPR